MRSLSLKELKLLVIGPARHGKETVGEIVRDHYGLTFESSSHFVAERAVRPALKRDGLVYPDFDTMYADRVNHRVAWFEAIRDYNADDPARLGRELFAQYDMYVGLRSDIELDALRREGAFDLAIWVDASNRVPGVDPTCKVRPDQADYLIDNNGTLDELVVLVHSLAHEIIATHWRTIGVPND